MDLFEYQARDLFAKHGVPVLAGEVIDTPEAAREATERLGGKSVVKAQVKVGGRGKAGGVKLAADPGRGGRARATDILGMDIKGHTVHKVMIAETAPEIAEEYYVSYLLDRTNRTFLAMASVAGRHGHRGGRGGDPRGPREGPGRRQRGRDHREGPRDRRPGEVPGRGRRPGRRGPGDPVEDLRRRGRAPRRGQPAGQGRLRRASSPSTARSPSTRTPSSASRSTRRSRTRTRPTRSRPPPRRRTSTTSSSTARSASSATARVSS